MRGQRTLLFLGASVSQAPAIRRARAVGFRTVAVDGDPAAVAFPLCHVAEAIDFSDVERVAEVARRERADGILAISTDRAVVPAARVADILGLPGPGVDVAVAMTSKAVMRTTLAAAHVPQPAFAALREAADLEGARHVRLPAVLKPSDSGGQRGLFRVESLEDALTHLPQTLAFARNGIAMLEEYVEGVELNGLFAVRDGVPTLLTLSDRLRPEGPGFGVGWIHSFPSSLPPETLERAAAVATDAIRALGLRNGIAFPQLIAASDGSVRVVEVAARIAAGQMADLVRLGAGINLYDLAFALALGDDVADAALVPQLVRPIAIRFLTASPGVLPVGEVERIEGLDRVRASEGVLAADVYFSEGAHLSPLQVDADRSGYVIATADTPALALDLADRAAKRLVVVTRGAGRRRRRRGRLVGELALVAAVLAGVVAAFVLSEGAKLQHALVAGTRVDKQFSPICRCRQDVADITLRLLRTGPVTIRMVNRFGRSVVTLLRIPDARAGRETIVWHGTATSGRRVPDGAYRPEVSFPRLGRTLVLPSPIVVDTDRPRIMSATLHHLRRGIAIRYVFGEPVHAELRVDGRRAVFTRSETPAGELRWTGSAATRFARGATGVRISLVGIDLAGNPSRPRAWR